MSELLVGFLSAFWLGLLTSMSPCPLATNIAAISFVGSKVDRPGRVFLSGLLYTIGRTVTYVVLGILLVSSLLSAPLLSHLLQKYMNKALGPVLILVGMILLELLHVGMAGALTGENMRTRMDTMGMWGALILGVVFALSFCPVSAALFFGSLIPLAVRYESNVLFPSAYGLATGLPVLGFAVLVAVGVKRIGEAYDRLVVFEKWARRITGLIFIIIGVYFCLVHIFGLGI